MPSAMPVEVFRGQDADRRSYATRRSAPARPRTPSLLSELQTVARDLLQRHGGFARFDGTVDAAGRIDLAVDGRSASHKSGAEQMTAIMNLLRISSLPPAAFMKGKMTSTSLPESQRQQHRIDGAIGCNSTLIMRAPPAV